MKMMKFPWNFNVSNLRGPSLGDIPVTNGGGVMISTKNQNKLLKINFKFTKSTNNFFFERELNFLRE